LSTDIYGEYGLPEPEKRYRVPETTVRAHLEALEAYGFTREDIRAMVRRMPTILGCTAERTGTNLATLSAIGVDVLTGTSLLMLAPDHLKGRVVVLMGRGITPQASSMGMGVKVWEKRFGLTREETVARAESFAALIAST